MQRTPGAMLMGPNGFFEMPDGVIRALRHAHLSPTDADFYSVAGSWRQTVAALPAVPTAT